MSWLVQERRGNLSLSCSLSLSFCLIIHSGGSYPPHREDAQAVHGEAHVGRHWGLLPSAKWENHPENAFSSCRWAFSGWPAITWATPSLCHPNSWPIGTGKCKLNACYFKPLCFGVIWYAIDDIIFHLVWDDSLLKHRLGGVLFTLCPQHLAFYVHSENDGLTTHLMTSLSPVLHGYLYIEIHTQKQLHNSSIKNKK